MVHRDDYCEYHPLLAENQATIQVHLLWMKKAMSALIGLVCICLGSLGTIAYSLIGVAHSLALQAQANRDGIIQLTSTTIRLEQTDKDICKRLERLEWRTKNETRSGIPGSE